MNSRKRKISEVPPSPPVLTSRQIVLPEDVILYMANFLCFVDYRSFIKALWPNNGESDIIRETLWRLLIPEIITTTFINGKRLEIEYNYDASRTKEDEVLINLNSLLPVIGKTVIPPAMDKFTSVWKIQNFVRKHVHLNKCSDYLYASCLCHLKKNGSQSAGTLRKPSVEPCAHGHFHHFCWQHVSHWLNNFLNNSLTPHGNAFFDEETTKGYLRFLGRTINFREITE